MTQSEILVKKENLYKGGISKVEVGMTLKINLGNYETADLFLTYTIDTPSFEKEKDAFDVVRATLGAQAAKTRAFIEAQRKEVNKNG